MVVAFQEMWMPKVLGIKEHVQDQAPREDRLGDFLPRLLLGPRARRTKENEFLQHHMTKMATIHVGCVEGNCSFVHFISFIFPLITEYLIR